MTGIAPYVVQGTGALGIILIGVMTIAGCFLCLCLAELATMWPDRTGGIPGYATESFRPLVGNTASRHIGGVSGWAYWLGWFPVAPINVILTASYLAVLFNFSPGHLITPVGTTWGAPIGITIVLVCFALLLAIFIPAALLDCHLAMVRRFDREGWPGWPTGPGCGWLRLGGLRTELLECP